MDQDQNQKIPRNHKDIGFRSFAAMFKDDFLPFTGLNLPKVKDVIQTDVPTIQIKDRGMDLNFLLEDNTIVHIEFESDALQTKDLVRFGHYDLELYNLRKQTIHRVIIFSAGVSQNTRTGLDIGSVKQQHNCIFLEHDFNGDEIYDKIKEKIYKNEQLTNIDKLHTILLPMMKSTQTTISKRAYELTKSLQTYKNKDEAHYLIGAMMAINYDHVDSPQKEKILEVLEMAKPFEDLYKKFEMIGIQKGKEEGIKEGIQKGKKEGEKIKALEIARKLIEKGIEPTIITELTGLNQQELEDILPKNL